MPRQHLTPGKDLVPIVQEAGWAPGPVWTGAENLAPPGFHPWTVQPVGSRHADYATRPTEVQITCDKISNSISCYCSDSVSDPTSQSCWSCDISCTYKKTAFCASFPSFLSAEGQ